MELLLRRRWLSPQSTIGELLLNGQPLCFTLEPPLGTNQVDRDAIPIGAYRTVLLWSPRFSAFLPGLLNVPGRSHILIHKGNFPSDTKGCILVGATRAEDRIGDSALAFNRVMPQLTFPLTLTIEVLQ